MNRRFALAVNVGVGALLLGLGIPQTVSALLRIPADIELPAIADGRTRDIAIIQSTQEALEGAAAQYPSALVASDIGWSHIYRWRISPAGAAGKAELSAAESSLRDSLSRSPANSRDWAGLALVRNALSDSQGAASALELSMMTYPYQRDWALWRCDIGFILYPKLSDFGRDLLSAQIRYVWGRQPAQLLTAAKLAIFSSPDGVTLLRTALARDPVLLGQLNAALAPNPVAPNPVAPTPVAPTPGAPTLGAPKLQ